jgi:hypothetical protein
MILWEWHVSALLKRGNARNQRLFGDLGISEKRRRIKIEEQRNGGISP